MVTETIRTDDRGFTLVEMLVVVLMLGVLSSMALLGVQGAQRSSTVQACVTDWQAINSALQAYGLDHRSPTTGAPDYSALSANPLTLLAEFEYLANATVSNPAKYRATVEVVPGGATYSTWIANPSGGNSTSLPTAATPEAVATACSAAVGQ